jgi:TonB family protein
MLLRRFAPIGFLIAARALAQDITVGDPVWLGSAPTPEVLPHFVHPLAVKFPAEALATTEIGYVVARERLDSDGKRLFLGEFANRTIYRRAVDAALNNCELTPALRSGHPIAADIYLTVIFNPASAPVTGPEAQPRLLTVTPVFATQPLIPAGGSGSVLLSTHLMIDAGGKIASLTPNSPGDAPLVGAIHDGVVQWRFAPARRQGIPFATGINLPIRVVPPWIDQSTVTAAPWPIRQVSPIYPLAMRYSHLRGEVMVQFIVDQNGNVQNPVVLNSNNPGFDEAALVAIRKWVFQPGRRDGRPVNVRMAVPIIFQLNEDLHDDLAIRVYNPGPGIPSEFPNDAAPHLDAFEVRSTGDQTKIPPEFRFDTAPHIRGVVLPIYPSELLGEQIHGSAEVNFLIDREGRVAAATVTHATRPEFGQALLAAVSMYQFEPARRQGQPTATILTQDQDFSLSMPTPAGMADKAASVMGDYELVGRIRQHPEVLVNAATLDHPLHPVSTRPAVFPPMLRGKATDGSALIEVVIDENGHTRIPRIVSASDPAFGYASVQAIASWLFDPPTVNGAKVVTGAQVPFEFKLK